MNSGLKVMLKGMLIVEKFSQSELNDLIRDLDLFKESSEVLASRLNKTNADARIQFYSNIRYILLKCV